MTEIQRNINELISGQRYSARVRAISGFGVYSDWSDALDFVTIRDTTGPKPPTNLVTNFSTTNLILAWSAPTQNVDSTTFNDFSHFEVKLLPTAGDPVTYQTKTGNFVYSFTQNGIDYTRPKRIFNIEVRALDYAGNASEPLMGTAAHPRPGDPINAPSLAESSNLIRVLMSPISANGYEVDTIGYTLIHSSDGVNWEFLALPTSETYVHEVPTKTIHYYKYKIRDSFNQSSINWSPVEVANATQSEIWINGTTPGLSDLHGDWGGDGGGIRCRSGHTVSMEWTGTALSFYVDGTTSPGNMQLSTFGTKTFVIPHPIDENKYLVHGTLEGPEAGVYYRDEAQLVNGVAHIELPHYFESLTHTYGRTVQLTPIYNGNTEPENLQASRVVDGGFTVYGTGDKSFFWEVKAIRKDVPMLEVEPEKATTRVSGDGPYTYIQPLAD